MESFFLAETVKYLYLLFDEDNFLHDTPSQTEQKRPRQLDGDGADECLYYDGGGYIFNTEAHPLDAGLIHCCSAQYDREIESLDSGDEGSLAGLPDADWILQEVDETFGGILLQEGGLAGPTELDEWLGDLWSSMRETIINPKQTLEGTSNYTLSPMFRKGLSPPMTCPTVSMHTHLQTMQDLDFRNLY